MEIYDVFVLFYRRKWLVLLILSVSIGANAWILSIEPDRFESRAKLRFNPQSSAMTSSEVLASVHLFQPFTLSLLQQLVNSTDFESNVREHLESDPRLRDHWEPAAFSVNPVGGDSGLNVLEVSYIADDPKLAEELLDASINALDDYAQSWFERGLQRARNAQQEVVDQQTAELEQIEADLAHIREEAELSTVSGDVRDLNQTLLAQIASLERDRLSVSAELEELRSNSIEAKPSLEPADYGSPYVFIELLRGTPIASEIEDTTRRLLKAENRAKEFAQQTTEEHPDRKKPWSEVHRIQATYDSYLDPETLVYSNLKEALVQRFGGPDEGRIETRARLRGVDAKLRMMDELIAEKRDLREKIRENERPIAQLEHQRSRLESELESGASLLRGLQQVATISPDVIEEFQKKSPGRPVGKKLQAFAGAIILLGLILAVGAVYGLELFDHRIHNQHDVRKHSGLALLAVIPDTSKSDDPESAMSGPIGEAFSSLAKKMLVGLESSDRIVAVTGPDASAGKTFVSANLGIAASRLGVKTLVVDADLRQPRIHELFQVARDPGLSELLAGELDPAELLEAIALAESTGAPLRIGWRDLERARGSGSLALVAEPSSRLGPVIQLTETLSVVTAGSADVDPVAGLSSHTARTFFEAARERFDFIVVDTPPLNIVSDALVLSERVDAYLPVIRAGQSTNQDLHWAKQSLEDVGATIAGIVLNGLHHRVPGYYSYYDGKRYYRARG